MKLLLAILCMLLAGPAAFVFGHGDVTSEDVHMHDPRFGGVVVESGGLDFELVVKTNLVRLYWNAHHEQDEPQTKTTTAVLTTFVAGKTVKYDLKPSKDLSCLEFTGTIPKLPKGTKVVIVFNELDRKSKTVRFVLP